MDNLESVRTQRYRHRILERLNLSEGKGKIWR